MKIIIKGTNTIDEYKAGLKKKKEEFRENIKNSTLTLEDFGITVDENGNMFDSNGNLIKKKKDENNNEDNNLNEEAMKIASLFNTTLSFIM